MTETFLSTGIGQLDEFLGGGLAPGSFVVVLAPTGSGVEILAKQFAAGRPEAAPEQDLYVATQESLEDIEKTLASFGMPGRPRIQSLADEYAHRLVEREKQHLAYENPEAIPSLLKAESRELIRRPGDADQEFLRKLIRPYASTLPPQRLTVSTVDFFISLYGPDAVATTLTAVKMENARLGGLVFVIMTKGAHPVMVEQQIEMLADCLIELESQRKGAQFEAFFVVKKVKNRFLGMGVAPYKLTRNGYELDNLDRIL